jgi:hypothetical protein
MIALISGSNKDIRTNVAVAYVVDKYNKDNSLNIYSTTKLHNIKYNNLTITELLDISYHDIGYSCIICEGGKLFKDEQIAIIIARKYFQHFRMLDVSLYLINEVKYNINKNEEYCNSINKYIKCNLTNNDIINLEIKEKGINGNSQVRYSATQYRKYYN